MFFSSVTSTLKLKTHSQLTQSPFTGTDCLFFVYVVQNRVFIHKTMVKNTKILNMLTEAFTVQWAGKLCGINEVVASLECLHIWVWSPILHLFPDDHIM